jgi:hypothetical protein
MADDPIQGKSVEAGRRINLPAGADRPIAVFVNGQEQREGADFVMRGTEILFQRPLMKEQVSGARWLAMALGLFGSYGRHDTVDVHFKLNGNTEVVSDAKVLP